MSVVDFLAHLVSAECKLSHVCHHNKITHIFVRFKIGFVLAAQQYRYLGGNAAKPLVFCVYGVSGAVHLMSSMIAIFAPSEFRNNVLVIRVYPPGRSL